MIQIDGSQGEGGGQILRSSLALSMVTGQPVTIDLIRAKRDKPGLLRQHLTAVRAATEVCAADVTGDEIGSSKLIFRPGQVVAGDYQFAVGTAGSAMLVLQTVLPSLMIASGPSRLILEGGTHNPWAPPFDFLKSAFLPLINRMGPKVSLTLEKHGFYPAGGGRVMVDIEPPVQLSHANEAAAALQSTTRLIGFDLMYRGEIRHRRARILIANLPEHIARREREELDRLATWSDGGVVIQTVKSAGPGNIVLLEIESEHVTEVFVGFGQHQVKAEHVAKQAIQAMRQYLVANVAVGPYLADQLLLPLGISTWQAAIHGEENVVSFQTVSLTRHSLSQIDVLRKFLGIRVTVVPSQIGNVVTVKFESPVPVT